jgi:hypothetical protein
LEALVFHQSLLLLMVQASALMWVHMVNPASASD